MKKNLFLISILILFLVSSLKGAAQSEQLCASQAAQKAAAAALALLTTTPPQTNYPEIEFEYDTGPLDEDNRDIEVSSCSLRVKGTATALVALSPDDTTSTSFLATLPASGTSGAYLKPMLKRVNTGGPCPESSSSSSSQSAPVIMAAPTSSATATGSNQSRLDSLTPKKTLELGQQGTCLFLADGTSEGTTYFDQTTILKLLENNSHRGFLIQPCTSKGLVYDPDNRDTQNLSAANQIFTTILAVVQASAKQSALISLQY